MTLKVAIVCEDHTNDQYILVPVVKSILADLGKPHARVSMVTNPRMSGISNLLDRICMVVSNYIRIADVIIVAIDLDGYDGLAGRPDRLGQLKAALDKCPSDKVVTVAAVNELEVWAVWGSRSSLDIDWSTVRQERDPKERYFDLLTTKGDLLYPGGGRKRLIALSLSMGLQSLISGCPEVGQLRQSIESVIVPG